MSFRDVGGPGARAPPRRAPASGGRAGGAFSSAAAGRGGPAGGPSPPRGAGGAAPSGYEAASDAIVQYQRNVGLLEKLARSAGTPHDTSVLQTQYTLQLDVIQQLGHRIESQLRAHETRLATLPRAEAAPLRTTHVKLTRDYRRVEGQFRHLKLDVQRKRSLAEARRREVARTEAEGEERRRREGAGGQGGEELTEEGMRWQMQIQEDKINEEIMREREAEIKHIHKGMHQVNEIYKDLAHLVDEQQEGIDQIETQMEDTRENTATGLKHIEKANEASASQCVVS